jgi:hypothetical protein
MAEPRTFRIYQSANWYRSPNVLVFESLSKALRVSPLGHVALLWLSEPARIQIKRQCRLIWHE